MRRINQALLKLQQDTQRIELVQRTSGGGGGGGSSSWGSISGTLSSQTDLQLALDAKAATTALPIAGQVSVTVPALAYEHEQTVAATGLTAGKKVLLSIAPHSDSDENHETMLDVDAMAGEPGTNTLTLRMAFMSPTSGAIRINYLAV